MSNTQRALLVSIAALVLNACATVDRPRVYLDGYIGQSIKVVQDMFGYNYAERQLDGGRTAYVWQWVRDGVRSTYHAPSLYLSHHHAHTGSYLFGGGYFSSIPYRDSCEFTFITDSSLLIKEWQARGDGCRRYKPHPVLRSQS